MTFTEVPVQLYPSWMSSGLGGGIGLCALGSVRHTPLLLSFVTLLPVAPLAGDPLVLFGPTGGSFMFCKGTGLWGSLSQSLGSAEIPLV